MRRPPLSLALRLLTGQVLPLALLAIALAVAGAAVADRVVQRTSDRLLAGSVMAIAEQVSARDGRVTVSLSPWSLGLLDGPERDAVFYSVWQGPRLVTGYRELPPSPSSGRDVTFRDGQVRGAPVRVGQTTLRIPGVTEPVSVAVAQTLDSRQASVRELLSSLITLPVLLVFAAAVLVWPATVWSLRPLRRLTDELTARSEQPRATYAPAALESVPVELSPLVRAYNALLANLDRSATAIERFAADASHQLRTPLSVITANLALLARPGPPPLQAAELLQDSRDAAGRLNLVLRQLLALARAEAAVAGGSADLGAAVRQVVEDGARLHPGARIRRRTPHASVTARGDATLVREMLQNLVSNAALYGGGDIVIRLGVWDGRPTITLWDHGPGLPAEGLQRLAERFYRGDQARETSGAGLGIAIVRAIAEAFDVVVTFENRRRRPGLVVRLAFQSA